MGGKVKWGEVRCGHNTPVPQHSIGLQVHARVRVEELEQLLLQTRREGEQKGLGFTFCKLLMLVDGGGRTCCRRGLMVMRPIAQLRNLSSFI